MRDETDNSPITDADTVQMTGRTYNKFKAAWEALEVLEMVQKTIDEITDFPDTLGHEDTLNELLALLAPMETAITKARGQA